MSHLLLGWLPMALAQEAPRLSLSGQMDAFYSWNFNQPANGVTAFRGFDYHHNTLSLASAVLNAHANTEQLELRLGLQAGLIASTDYLAEPVFLTVSGGGASDPTIWRSVQQAWGAWKPNERLRVEAGLFLSPIGPESINAQDNWNYSRSYLFFGLPFYHSGLRASTPLGSSWTLGGAVYNGWNNVVDNNLQKSFAGHLAYSKDRVSGQLLYFGGVERQLGDAQPWRHLVDLWVQFQATERLGLRLHTDWGAEVTPYGLSGWGSAALYARVGLTPKLAMAARADTFVERAAQNDDGAAPSLFWPANAQGQGWIGSGTLTLDYRPVEGLNLLLEARHDRSGAPSFYQGEVELDADSGAALLNTRTQTTATLAAVVWL